MGPRRPAPGGTHNSEYRSTAMITAAAGGPGPRRPQPGHGQRRMDRDAALRCNPRQTGVTETNGWAFRAAPQQWRPPGRWSGGRPWRTRTLVRQPVAAAGRRPRAGLSRQVRVRRHVPAAVRRTSRRRPPPCAPGGRSLRAGPRGPGSQAGPSLPGWIARPRRPAGIVGPPFRGATGPGPRGGPVWPGLGGDRKRRGEPRGIGE